MPEQLGEGLGDGCGWLRSRGDPPEPPRGLGNPVRHAHPVPRRAPRGHLAHDELAGNTSAVSALDELYKAARRAFDADPAFADRSRARVVALQASEPTTVARWKEIVTESERDFRDIYDRFGVLLVPGDSVGESFYNDLLADTITDLVDAGIAVESAEAL